MVFDAAGAIDNIRDEKLTGLPLMKLLDDRCLLEVGARVIQCELRGLAPTSGLGIALTT